MRGKLEQGVAFAGAQIIDLAAWRKGLRPKPDSAFPATDRPGMDFNEMGHGLKLAAYYVREGRMGAKDIAKLLEGLSVNAAAASRTGHDIELRILRAERILSRQFGGIEGKALERAIAHASKEAAKANRRDERQALKTEREGRKT